MMNMSKRKSLICALWGATALALMAPQVSAQSPEGFVISINGEAIAGDVRVREEIRRTDIQLAQADVQVVYDGLGGTPRLDLQVLGGPQSFDAGQTVTVQSELNYPAYVERGEIRVMDMGARGGPRVIEIVPVSPNGQARITVPQGDDIVLIHRVYDARGRFDATAPIPLSRADRRPDSDSVEDGADATARRRIPVYGGSVTISGDGLRRSGSRCEPILRAVL